MYVYTHVHTHIMFSVQAKIFSMTVLYDCNCQTLVHTSVRIHARTHIRTYIHTYIDTPQYKPHPDTSEALRIHSLLHWLPDCLLLQEPLSPLCLLTQHLHPQRLHNDEVSKQEHHYLLLDACCWVDRHLAGGGGEGEEE